MTGFVSFAVTASNRWPALLRDRKAVAAIEFALVGLPMIFLIFGMFIFGLHFLTQASIDTATRAAARQIQMGAIRNGSSDQVRSFICPLLGGLVKDPCTGLQIYAASGTTFASLTAATVTGATLSKTTFATGGAGDSVLLQVAYNNPKAIPLVGMTSLTVLSTIAFKNEP